MTSTNNPLGTEQTPSDCGAGLPPELQQYANPLPGGTVDSVNGQTGNVALDSDDIPEGNTNKYSTPEVIRDAISGIDPIEFNKATGEISHKDSAITAGSYGSDTQYAQFTVDAKGHITAVTLKDRPASTSVGERLAALDALTGLGYLVKTGDATWALRSLTGTSGRVKLTTPDGSTGATKIDLDVVGTPGVFGSANKVPKITVDAYGRITGIELIPIAIGSTTTVPSLGSLTNVQDEADEAETGMILIFDGTNWIPQLPVETPITPKSTPTVTLQVSGTDNHTLQADVNILEVLTRIKNTPALKDLFCEISASCPVATTTWIADSTVCERSSKFNVSKTIINLYSPMLVTYDTASAKAFVTDSDNTDGLGNIAWFNPLTAASSADFTYSNKVAKSNVYCHVADPEKRKIYLAGKDTGGLIVYDIPTDSISTVAYGTDGVDFNRVNVVMIGNNIYCSDSVAKTLVQINRTTLVVSKIIDLTTVPSPERFTIGGFLIVGNDTEIYVCAGSGSSVSSVGVYSPDFSTLIAEINLPGAAQWTGSKYWASAFYDAVSKHVYIGEPGSSQTFIIDTTTHAIIATGSYNNRRGKTNATFGWTVNPITNELMLTVTAQNTPTDGDMKSSMYIENRETFEAVQSFSDISVGQLVGVDNSTLMMGAYPGLTGWSGGATKDGKITLFDSAASGDNTTRLLTLTLKEMSAGAPTGQTKPNSVGDPDYIAPVTDAAACPLVVDLSCVQQVITTPVLPLMYYEFDLPQSVIINGAVAKLRMSAFDSVSAAIVGTQVTIDKPADSFVSGVINAIPAGSAVTLQVEYLDAGDAVLKTCNS